MTLSSNPVGASGEADAGGKATFDRLPDFVCAICQRTVDMQWAGFRVRKDTPLAPFCPYCEHHYSAGIGQPQHGSFRDRREVKRGFAIAEALHCAAMQQKWSGHVIA